MEGAVTARVEREGRRDLLFFCSCGRGRGYNELTLSEVGQDEGKELVARAKFSVSHPK